MTPSDLRNIHTTRNCCRDTFPCMNMTLKLTQYFYLLMDKSLDHYFQVCSSCYQAAQCHQKTPTLVSSNDRSGLRKPKKKVSIKTNHSYHQHSSPKASLNYYNNKARFSFNQPNSKR